MIMETNYIQYRYVIENVVTIVLANGNAYGKLHS
jgi:hypothetical protein